MRALVADDDRLTTVILSGALQRQGFDVTVVHDGTAAWNHIAGDTAPSLAIVDWMMPGLDGLELCRRVRQEPSRAHLYVILLTSRAERGDVIAGLDAGADDYLTKPFHADELRARVRVGCRVLALQQRLAEQVAELQEMIRNNKQLRGLLPICSYCKRIRGDDQYWQQVEGYVAEHSDAQFSHGICPPCYEKVSAEIDEMARNKSSRQS
jgi:phosphoserine phosphatase RsbU/P